ncbi:hypothetical protein AWP95_13980, partial [Escherichia coli]
TDNGSCYRANETRQFARMLGLEPKNTAVRSPESNGIAERASGVSSGVADG